MRIVVQESLSIASSNPPTEVASEYQEEEFEKAQLERAMKESLLEANRAQRRHQNSGRREQIEVQQAIAVSLTERTNTRYRQLEHGHVGGLEVQQSIKTSLRDATDTRPRPREVHRHKRARFQQVTVESHTETTTTIKTSLNQTNIQRRDLKRDRSKLEQLELQLGIDTSLRERANKRPRHTRDPLTEASNTRTRPRHNETRNPAIPRSSTQPSRQRIWGLPTRPAQPRPRPEARVAVNGTGATSRPADRTRAVDPRPERTLTVVPRLERTRPIYPLPIRTDATGRPTGRSRAPDPHQDGTRHADPIPDRTRPINRPANRPRPVYPTGPTAGRAIDRPVEIPRAEPNPIPELRLALAVPVTAAEINRWLWTREGPRPVAKCFGACGNKLVFRGLQSDNGRREPCVILACGHLVGGKCFSDLVDMAKASGEDTPCPHCGIVPMTAAV